MDRLREKVTLICLIILLAPKLSFAGQFESPVNELKKLRKMQVNSSIGGYQKLENKILESKKEFGVPGVKTERHRNFLFYLVHIFPFILWQILVLFSLTFFIFFERKRFSLFPMILFFIALLAIFAGYRERCTEWHIVENSGEYLRLGPGENYPVRVNLKTLDELKIKHVVEVDKEKWMQVEHEGVTGWYKND